MTTTKDDSAADLASAKDGALKQAPDTASALSGYPFFGYRDFSQHEDPDPLTPLTPAGRVPNFTAKMHAILSRPDLRDIVTWLPHGRSWRVLKPREFEVKVLPTYFEHSKFSSFIRQANGWGFRRITQGNDRNSYLHPLFLKGLPHLCKGMKRPRVNEKKTAKNEPDLYEISRRLPLPEIDTSDIQLDCTVQGGPKARMPIYTGPTGKSPPLLTPQDQKCLQSFAQSLDASEHSLRRQFPGPAHAAAAVTQHPLIQGRHHAPPLPSPLLTPQDQTGLQSFSRSVDEHPGITLRRQQPLVGPTHAANQHPLARRPHQAPPPALSLPRPWLPSASSYASRMIPGPSSSTNNTLTAAAALTSANRLALRTAPSPFAAGFAAGAASASPSFASPSFAAGFAAATAYSQQQMQSLLLGSLQRQQQPPASRRQDETLLTDSLLLESLRHQRPPPK